MKNLEKLIEIKNLLESDYIEHDIEALQPKQRLDVYLNLMEFFVPKQQRSSINPDDKSLPDDIYTMTL